MHGGPVDLLQRRHFVAGTASVCDHELGIGIGQRRRMARLSQRPAARVAVTIPACAPIRRDFLAKAHETSNLNWMSYVDLRLRLPELLLMRVDKMTMGVGLEARVPFLDHELVTLAMSIPSARKAPNGRLKHLLKTAVRDLVPRELIERKKQGFGVPVDDLFAGRLADVATREITRFCNDTGLIDRDRGPRPGAHRPGRQDLVPPQPRDVVAALHRAASRLPFADAAPARDFSPDGACATAPAAGTRTDGDTVVTVDRLRAALASGSLLAHLFRYREARILTHRLETIGRPLKLAMFLRLLSRGACYVEDERGQRRPLSGSLIARWAWQSVREPFRKSRLLDGLPARSERLVADVKPSPARRRWTLPRHPLYLRTDLSFGLKAGGSVGHTAGVVNHLGDVRRRADHADHRHRADGARRAIEVHTVAPAEAFWEYPELPSLVMNDRFAAVAREAIGSRPLVVRLPALQPEQLRRRPAGARASGAVRARVQRLRDLDEPSLGHAAAIRDAVRGDRARELRGRRPDRRRQPADGRRVDRPRRAGGQDPGQPERRRAGGLFARRSTDRRCARAHGLDGQDGDRLHRHVRPVARRRGADRRVRAAGRRAPGLPRVRCAC